MLGNKSKFKYFLKIYIFNGDYEPGGNKHEETRLIAYVPTIQCIFAQKSMDQIDEESHESIGRISECIVYSAKASLDLLCAIAPKMMKRPKLISHTLY